MHITSVCVPHIPGPLAAVLFLHAFALRCICSMQPLQMEGIRYESTGYAIYPANQVRIFEL